MNEPIKIDVYEDDKQDFINKHILAPQWPFRLLIVGPSGCGKTNLLINLVLKYLAYSKIYVYAKDLNEFKYRYLEEYFENIQENIKNNYNIDEDFYIFSSDKDDIIDVDDLDPNFQNLIIFDDFLTERDQSLIKDLFIRGRKKNCSVIYLTQSYYSTPKDIRLNCNYFIIYQISNKREIDMILQDNCPDLTKDQFIKKYNLAIKDKFNFFTIDLKDPDKKYRKNLDIILK